MLRRSIAVCFALILILTSYVAAIEYDDQGISILNNEAIALSGDGTVFDDLRVPLSAVKVGSTKVPEFAAFTTGPTTLAAYWFDDAAEECVYFYIQLRHAYLLESTVFPHVHWTPKATADGAPANQLVKWDFNYSLAEVGGDFGAATTLSVDSLVLDRTPADANAVASRHYISDFDSITMTGIDTTSAMFICSLCRDGADVTDTFEGDAGLLEIDIHIEMDSLGSRTEYVK